MVRNDKLQTLEVNFLKEGALLSGILYDDTGRMLWPASKALTSSFIHKLKEKGIKEIFYSPPKFKNAPPQEPMFTQETQEFAQEAIQEIAHQIRFGKFQDIKLAKVTIERFFYEMETYPSRFLNLMVLKDYDSYTYYHSINVGILSMFLTRKLGFNHIFVKDVGLGGFLHDIGKISVPPHIVNKRGRLTDDEFKMMKNHPIYGFNLLKDEKTISNFVKKMVLFHHERWDGSGYPLHLRQEAIGNFASIVAVADVYDALTTERSYKEPFSINEALIYLMRHTFSHFNPYVSQRFINEIARMYELGSFYPVGGYVQLNTGETGYISDKEDEYTMRPQVVILKNFQGLPLRNPIQADLKRDSSRIISKTIDDPEEIERLSTLL